MSDVDWKKRALVAEARLHGYKRLREIAEKVHAAWVEFNGPGVGREYDDSMFEDLADELRCLDEVHPARDFLRQKIGKLLAGVDFEIGLSNDLGPGELSTLRLNPSIKIEVNAKAAEAAQYVALLFQLLQLADIAAGQMDEAEPTVTAKWFQDRAPALLVLLIATGLLNPEVPVTTDDVQVLAAG